MSRARHGKVQDQRRSKTRKVGPRALDRGKLTQELLTLVTRTVPLDSLAQESTGVPAGLARRALSSILAHAVHEGRTILLLAASRDHWDRL